MSQFQQESSMQEAVGYEGDSPPSELEALLAKGIDLAPTPLVEAMTRAEVDIQMNQARKSPRSLKKFYDTAVQMATLNEAVAASCMYALPRGKNKDNTPKFITGPSIRMAEIVASAWQNIRVETRIVEIGEDAVTARGMCIDLENNNGQSVEVRRSILDKYGKRYNSDMIGVTSMAAISLARRNAIFAVVPRAFIDPIADAARKVAVGDEKTLSARREAMMVYFTKLGLTEARVLASIGVAGVQDITLDKLAILRGYATSLKTGEANIETVFPDPSANGNGNGAKSGAALLAEMGKKPAATNSNTPGRGAGEAGAAHADPRGEAPQQQDTGEQPSAAVQEPPFQQQSADEFMASLADVPEPGAVRRNGRQRIAPAPQ